MNSDTVVCSPIDFCGDRDVFEINGCTIVGLKKRDWIMYWEFLDNSRSFHKKMEQLSKNSEESKTDYLS